MDEQRSLEINYWCPLKTHTNTHTSDSLACSQLKSICWYYGFIWDLVTASHNLLSIIISKKMFYMRETFLVPYCSSWIPNNWEHIKYVLSVTSFGSAKHISNTEERVFCLSILSCWSWWMGTKLLDSYLKRSLGDWVFLTILLETWWTV